MEACESDWVEHEITDDSTPKIKWAAKLIYLHIMQQRNTDTNRFGLKLLSNIKGNQWNTTMS